MLVLGALESKATAADSASETAPRMQLSYRNDVEHCDDERGFRELVAARLGRDPFGAEGPALQVDVRGEGAKNVVVRMTRNIQRYVLPPRPARTYPRAIKIKMSNYDRKKPGAELK